MIYLVTMSKELFDRDEYKIISVKESLDLMKDWKVKQYDSETLGKDAHIGKLLLMQFGNRKAGNQIVIDATTIDPRLYKEVLENSFLIGQNLKFDLQWLYNYGIHPMQVYDTMIVEQFLHLGYPSGLSVTPELYEEAGFNFPYHKVVDNKTGRIKYQLSYALDAIAENRLHIHIDKTVRGKIQYEGITPEVILYGAGDVTYLEDIMWSQMKDISKIPNAKKGAQIECYFTPVIAYLEWCGIKLDETKWKAKMRKDKEHLIEATNDINDWFLKYYHEHNGHNSIITIHKESSDVPRNAKNVTFIKNVKKNENYMPIYGYDIDIPLINKKGVPFIQVNRQYDLFSDNSSVGKEQCMVKWTSSDDVIIVAKALGFNTQAADKKTGETKDSVMEKVLTMQKGVNDEFLNLYFGHGNEGDDDYLPGFRGSFKVVTSFGQGHLNAVNPKTGRIHTVYRAIGTISGRMASGSKQPNTDLAKLKKIPPSKCTYPNMQQLPHDKETRACFVAEKGNLFCSCDYSAMEARIGADVYNEHKLLNEFLYGSGDTHAAYAKEVFSEELKDIPTKDVKKKRPDLRTKVKSIEFAVQFGSDGTAVAPQLKISVEEARKLVNNLLNGMTGLKKFKEDGSKFVMSHGYVNILPQTGHRGYWYNWEHWKEVQASFDSDFWDEYRAYHKGTGDEVAIKVKEHFKDKSKWCDRMCLNLPTQGGGAVVLKIAATRIYRWIVENGYFGKILLVNLTHDEINSEFPEELKDTYPQFVAKTMKDAAALFFHKLPIPAEAEVEPYWKH